MPTHPTRILLRSWWRDAGRALEALIFPCACVACDQWHPVGSPDRPFCSVCAQSLEPDSSPPTRARDLRLDSTRAAWLYGGAMAEAIRLMKRARRRDIAVELAALLSRSMSPPRADLIVPIPLHPRRLAERGFAPAALFARAAAHGRPSPGHAGAGHGHPRLEDLALVRLRDTPRQSGLSLSARAANVAGAFEVVRPRAIAGRRILLVDDVLTTGATLGEAAAALRAAGAVEVHGLTLARTVGP